MLIKFNQKFSHKVRLNQENQKKKLSNKKTRV